MKTIDFDGAVCVSEGECSDAPLIFVGRERGGASRGISLGETVKSLAPGQGFFLVSFEVESWNDGFSPWFAPPVRGDEAFGGNGEKTLSRLTDRLIPAARRETGCKGSCFAAGYSLAGLFALWAFLKTDYFRGAAGCSPSLWFPGWSDFAAKNPLDGRSGLLYLSLGEKEEKTRNPKMSTVGDAVRDFSESAEKAPDIRSALFMQPGGHFNEPELRLASGLAWLINNNRWSTV